jgi:hypothetical protein
VLPRRTPAGRPRADVHAGQRRSHRTRRPRLGRRAQSRWPIAATATSGCASTGST